MTPNGPRPLRLLGIAGSLRERSYNRALLRTAEALAPDGVEIERFDLAGLPLYNGDLDSDERRPEPVERLKAALAAADGLLVATPEYNHTVPGVLQNAVDWASRPARRSPLAGKPIGMMGAAPGTVGTARAQEHLKLTLLSTLALVHPHPGVLVGQARDKFDADLRLTDARTRDFLAAFLADFADWVRQVQPEPAEAA
ncbi:MAG: NAD(P)H-dependent oxidoreductase [Rhodothermales bacterium]|nr:NAD(P)H-dependent oxidoreductase [Rhodothermales bacterium]